MSSSGLGNQVCDTDMTAARDDPDHGPRDGPDHGHANLHGPAKEVLDLFLLCELRLDGARMDRNQCTPIIALQSSCQICCETVPYTSICTVCRSAANNVRGKTEQWLLYDAVPPFSRGQ